VDPSTGIERPVPYSTAFIRLDGADTALSHFLDCADREKLKVGARVFWGRAEPFRDCFCNKLFRKIGADVTLKT